MTARTLELEKLYSAEQGRLRSIVCRIVRNRSTADDLVQQAFANMLGAPGDSPSNSAYVTRAARNLALNHLRDAKRHGEVELCDAIIRDLRDPGPTPETIVLHRSELRKLLEAVNELSPRRREAFVYNRIEGLTYDEVAERMRISRNTVITLVVTALAELDRLL